jgi:hypothetical protein
MIMHLHSIFELILSIDSDKFSKIFDQVYNTFECVDENQYADYALASKGITVLYQDNQYKKKIKMIVNPFRLLDSDSPDPDKLIRKLEKRISVYFNSKYQLDDFELSGMTITTDIDVRSSERVSDYMKVLQRIGKVKGFSPSRDNWLDDDTGICYYGNSNDIAFKLYDLEALHGEEPSDDFFNIEQPEDYGGLLRAEVRLMKPKAIRGYTNKSSISKQIADLHDDRQKIFLETFLRIVPFGDFYKKGKAEEIIRVKVGDATIRRRMLRLVELIPDKKSLLLAQKALNYRRIDKVMKAFFDIEVAPITISKRHDIRKLDNLYNYL